MDSFNVALNAVLPMFIMLGLGWFFRRIKLTDERSLNRLNKLCFSVFMAVSVYYNIYKVDIAAVFNGRLLLYAVAAQLAIAALSLIPALIIERTRKRRGAVAHCMLHTNFIIFGTLIATSLCGEENLGSISLLAAIIVPLQNTLSVIVLELSREGGRVDVKHVLLGVVKNPYVIAAAAGFLTKLIGLQFPAVLSNVLRDLGRCGTPTALIVMGGLFNFSSVRKNLRTIVAGVGYRLLIVPAIMLPVTVAFGFRGAEFVALMCIFVAPCANSCFNLAGAMDSDTDLTSQLIVFTSLCSLGTIFGWIYLLSRLGVIAA